MKYFLCDMFRDDIEAAKDPGIWQLLTLEEKEEMAGRFLLEYGSEADEIEMDGEKVSACRRQRHGGECL